MGNKFEIDLREQLIGKEIGTKKLKEIFMKYVTNKRNVIDKKGTIAFLKDLLDIQEIDKMRYKYIVKDLFRDRKELEFKEFKKLFLEQINPKKIELSSTMNISLMMNKEDEWYKSEHIEEKKSQKKFDDFPFYMIFNESEYLVDNADKYLNFMTAAKELLNDPNELEKEVHLYFHVITQRNLLKHFTTNLLVILFSHLIRPHIFEADTVFIRDPLPNNIFDFVDKSTQSKSKALLKNYNPEDTLHKEKIEKMCEWVKDDKTWILEFERYQKDNKSFDISSRETKKHLLAEYLRFINLSDLSYCDSQYWSPIITIDLRWHTHMIFAEKYIEFCKKYFYGTIIHEPKPERHLDKGVKAMDYEFTKNLYFEKYGIPINYFIHQIEFFDISEIKIQSGLRTNIFKTIFKYLTAKETLATSLVCKEWLALSRDDSVWDSHFSRDFIHDEMSLKEQTFFLNFKKDDKNLFKVYWSLKDSLLQVVSEKETYNKGFGCMMMCGIETSEKKKFVDKGCCHDSINKILEEIFVKNTLISLFASKNFDSQYVLDLKKEICHDLSDECMDIAMNELQIRMKIIEKLHCKIISN
eukprot:TRINITY_DN16773_c0_g1_i1.p1 TRINITY_DN16773_c0_g1~~TRINITY_DN16773_c0_g1_i1.p1  ORF type:complete len:581 (-),score=131.02 TRINITY_DN16773_c0_g1_i1:23-1765(-)